MTIECDYFWRPSIYTSILKHMESCVKGIQACKSLETIIAETEKSKIPDPPKYSGKKEKPEDYVVQLRYKNKISGKMASKKAFLAGDKDVVEFEVLRKKKKRKPTTSQSKAEEKSADETTNAIEGKWLNQLPNNALKKVGP